MASNIAYGPQIKTDGLIVCLDANNTKSYPGSGTVWYNLASQKVHYTLLNWTLSTKEGIKGLLKSESVTTDSAYIRSTNVNNFSAKLGFQYYMSYGPFTVSFWDYQTAYATDGSQTCGSAFSTATDGTDAGIAQMQINHGYNHPNTNGYSFRLPAGNVPADALGNPEPLNVWTNHVLTVSENHADGVAHYYRNGVLHTTNTTYTAWSATTDGTNGYHYLMRDVDDENNFAGYVAQILIYKRILSAQDVKQNYNAFKGRFGL
tara:strand:- start:34 stop:816 length:783 start_codon:yes stop_codon:yes gene_type:complete